MSIGRIEDRIKKMKEAIQTEAKQRAQHIVERSEQEADIERVNIIRQEKEKINAEFEKYHSDQVVKAKIQKSSVVNRQIIKKIQAMYRMVQNLKEQLKERLKEIVQDDSQYSSFMTQIITQSCLRMMQKHVSVECRAQDSQIMSKVLKNCECKFSQIFSRQVGQDLKVQLSMSQYSLEQRHKNIIGGVFMRSSDGLIVCDNSLDARVDLIFEQLLPQIRQSIFPKK